MLPDEDTLAANPSMRTYICRALLLITTILVLPPQATPQTSAEETSSASLFSSESEPPAPELVESPPESIDELQQRISKILKETHTPGAGVAIAAKDRVIWAAGIGLADVATRAPVRADTLFRIGSVSQSFVAFSILKLQEQGKLRLSDPVRPLVPDIPFTNPWRDTNPVRIVHLLENTTGWDDLHLAEYVNNDPTPLSLHDGLLLHPDSRISRWRPGTREAYCNSGAAVAAYIVEKLSGLPYQDYVAKEFFRPLEMPAAIFSEPDEPRSLTTLYHENGVFPYPYQNLSLRPSGAMNASPAELAHLLQFFLGRGRYKKKRLLTAASIERMEHPESTWAAHLGMQSGYGLSNVVSFGDGLVFHGHEGSLDGALTDLAYLPEAGIGYVLVMNTSNRGAYQRLVSLLRNYVSEGVPKAVLPAIATVSESAVRPFTGYYEPAAPRHEWTHGLLRLSGMCSLRWQKDELVWNCLPGIVTSYVPVSSVLFRRKDLSLATLSLVSNSEGKFVQTDRSTWRRISTLEAGTEWTLAGLSLLAMTSSLVYAVVWVPLRLFGHPHGSNTGGLRLYPLLAILCLGGAVAILTFWLPQSLADFGNVTPWSLAVYGLSGLFGVFSLIGLLVAFGHRKTEHRSIWWHSLVVSVANVVLTIYLASWGYIGFRTWI